MNDTIMIHFVWMFVVVQWFNYHGRWRFGVYNENDMFWSMFWFIILWLLGIYLVSQEYKTIVILWGLFLAVTNRVFCEQFGQRVGKNLWDGGVILLILYLSASLIS